MIRFFRLFGFLLIIAGLITLIVYLFPYIDVIWIWFRMLSLPIQIGMAVGIIGFLLLMVSLIVERVKDRRDDGDLHEDL